MKVGFVAAWDGQRFEFRLSGREASNGLLTVCREGGLAAVVLGRLLYRSDLAARLGTDDTPDTTDAALALEAYRRFGPEAVERLEGTFTVAVWDGRARRLVAARDPMGGYPLFWARSGDRWAVSTDLVALRREFPDAGLDPEYAADYLMLPSCGQNEVRSTRTPFRGLHRVLPGHALDADGATGEVRVRRYWEWLDRIEDPGTDRFEEVARGYAERLRAAVRAAARGTTAAHLSGGMDSTAVCMLALEPGAKLDGPLHTVSLVYDRMRVLARERGLIEGLTRDRAGVVAHHVPGDDMLNFDCYADPPAHDEPWAWLSSAEVERSRVEVAVAAGADTVLTGHGADEMADVGPYHLTDLLRRGRLLRAWAVAVQAARAENCSVWSILHPFGLINLLPLAAREGVGPLLRGGYTGWHGIGEDTVPPWVPRDFARSHGLRARGLEHTRETFFGCRPTVLSVARAKVLNRAGDAGRWYLSTPRGVLTCHPFLDPRLLRYCLGIHSRIAPPPRGQPKPLLAEAMRGVLPEEIRTRPKAGFFNEPYFRGIARHLGRLEALVRDVPDPLGVVDRPALLTCLRQSALGIGNARAQLDRVNLTLSLLRWLEGFPRWYREADAAAERVSVSPGTTAAATGTLCGVS